MSCKRIHKVYILIFASFSFWSCSNDIEINIPDQNMPVVHFILDPFEKEYYATLSRSIVPEENVYNIIKNTDSVYPNGTELTLELWNDTLMLWYTGFSTADVCKEEGLFSSGPGYLMKADHVIPEIMYGDVLEEGVSPRYFRIIVEGGGFPRTAYSRVELLPYPDLVLPYFVSQNTRFYGPNPFIVAWEADRRMSYFDLFFEMEYTEVDMDSNSFEKKLAFPYVRDIQSASDSYNVIIDPDYFFRQLAKGFENESNLLQFREIKFFNIMILGADTNFEEFTTHQEIAGEHSYREWTNITNGLGVFTIRYQMRRDGFECHPETIDSLAVGRFTKGLKFKRHH